VPDCYEGRIGRVAIQDETTEIVSKIEVEFQDRPDSERRFFDPPVVGSV